MDASEAQGSRLCVAVLSIGSPRLKAMGHGVSAQHTPAGGNAGGPEWKRPDTWPPRKSLPPPGPDAPHVVLSTKFGEPWYTISRGLKQIL